MKTWLRQHRLAFASATGKLTAQKSATVASILAIGIAFSLPLAGYVLIEPLRGALGRVAFEPQLTLYMQAEAQRSDTLAVGKALRNDKRIGGVRLITREAALKEMSDVQGLGDIVAALGANPLPDAFVVQPKIADQAALAELTSELRSLPKVSMVQADSVWAARLAALAAIGRMVLMFLATLLAFGLVAVTFNTIRLQILTLREEIEVSKLLGATDSFIRRPYYYLGALQGALGGAVALAVVWFGIYLANVEVRALADSYGSAFRVSYPSAGDTLSVVLYAGLLGWLGAHLSVARHLREIEPS